MIPAIAPFIVNCMKKVRTPCQIESYFPRLKALSFLALNFLISYSSLANAFTVLILEIASSETYPISALTS
jgi:hypothetical protein